MRISDWSSDVCSSDLLDLLAGVYVLAGVQRVFNQFPADMNKLSQQGEVVYLRREVPRAQQRRAIAGQLRQIADAAQFLERRIQIGRASWRERVCQEV